MEKETFTETSQLKTKIMNKGKLTIGTDPELMLADASGTIVNSLPVLKKDKHDPIKLDDNTRLYCDNVLVELSMKPATSSTEMVNRLTGCFRMASDALPNGFSLVPKAAHYYDALPPKPSDEIIHLVTTGQMPDDVIPLEWQIGCNPNYDVYAGTVRSQARFSSTLRTGSFHIHIGNKLWQDDSETELLTETSKKTAIRLLDIYLGCQSVVFDADESSKLRRSLYGGAGEWRPTPYGVEYRVLSNFALRHPMLAKACFDLAIYAMSFLNSGYDTHILKECNMMDVQKAINTSDATLARSICKKYPIPHEIEKAIAEACKAIKTTSFRDAWQF